MKIHHLLLLTIICFAMVSPVLAEPTMTFRDMNVLPGGYQSFAIYEVNANGTNLIGIFNSTTEALKIDHNSSYIAQFIPSHSDYVAKPMMIVTDVTSYITGHYPALIMVFFLFCLFCMAIYLAARG
nr:hypothetical protein [uncultured Methanoregula sp.]